MKKQSTTYNLQLSYDNGSILIYTVVIIFIFSLVMLGLLSYANIQLRTTRSSVTREQAFQIAEAGANYYEWHLANYPNDFWDGNASTTPGPYVHNYVDSDTGNTIGQFSLSITPPTVGSTIVTVQSTGYASADPSATRTVTVRYGIPSLAQYAFLANSDDWIGSTESISGQFFTNGGLRFDGTANAPIMSAKATYTCEAAIYGDPPCPSVQNGIWGTAATSTRNFWQFPVPNTDFSSITANLATLKSSAQSAGIYLAPSSADGYSLVFLNNGTVNIYKVTSLVAGEPEGYDTSGNWHTNSLDYQNRTLLSNKPIPANGVIYVEDNLWVEGTVKGRVTVAAAVLPYVAGTAPSIMIPNNIVYLAKDGTNSLGLISQQDILVTYDAPNSLEIDAALIAQNGADQRWYYASGANSLRTGTITIFGALASNATWTWNWVSSSSGPVVSGYENTNTTYDSNLLYAAPPSFPLSSSGYQQISWGSN
jgi:Tfp pilus assembly protein PilX